MEKRFEEIEHTADIAIRVWGRDLTELFVNAAYGLACQLTDPDAMERTIERTIALEAYDAETLLVTWLEELLYLGERDECVFIEFDVREIASTRLRAIVKGGPVQEHGRHIKAVTFNEMEIVCTGAGCETVIVFDV
ncbi:MAG: archease [Chloroflexota bacterium]|nr:archease [Chloroflexota bacterium]